MTAANHLQFALAFAFVLALIGVLALLARRFGLGYAPRAGSGRRLAICEVMPIDARRKLVLIRRDATEHLVLLEPSTETVVETGIGAAEGPFGSVLGKTGDTSGPARDADVRGRTRR